MNINSNKIVKIRVLTNNLRNHLFIINSSDYPTLINRIINMIFGEWTGEISGHKNRNVLSFSWFFASPSGIITRGTLGTNPPPPILMCLIKILIIKKYIRIQILIVLT